MKSPFWPLQVALVARIKSETNYAVYDNHPEQAKFPYIIVGEIQAQDWMDKSKPGSQVIATIHFWSQYAGKKEVAAMIDQVMQAIDYPWNPNLAPDLNVVLHQLDLSEIIVDVDALTFHGILKWKYLIEEL